MALKPRFVGAWEAKSKTLWDLSAAPSRAAPLGPAEGV